MKNMKLRTKIILPTTVLIVALLALTLVIATVQYTGLTDYLLDRRMDTAANGLREFAEEARRMSIDLGIQVSSDPRVIAGVMADGTPEEINAYLMNIGLQLKSELPVTFITFMNSEGIALARTAQPENFNDIISTPSLLAALQGEISVAYSPVQYWQIPIRSAVPVFHDGNIVGAVITAFAIDDDMSLAILRERFQADFTIFVGDMRVASTLLDTDGNSVVGTRMTDEYILRTVFQQNQEYITIAEIGGITYSSFYLPLVGEDGDIFGVIFMGFPIAEVLSQRNNVTLIVVIIGVVGVVIGVLIVLFISKGISKPIGELDRLLGDTGRSGNIVWQSSEVALVTQYKDRKDEVGRLFASYEMLVNYLIETSDELDDITDGDLSITVNSRGENDVLSQTMVKMIDNLNNMFGEINTATRQVSAGSRQIADGSQTLAQGSTEQAASVQELSSSIVEIAQKTKNNADMAGRAANLASNIKESAKKGSAQMDEMMIAVKDISESSKNISKVIKSIDDIAFQTNILALNAAVEAARAGQHGKGFAVVAEEVRNLAAKSAEAAKDTESLIADSIEKANYGSKIADDTAASLVEIVDGIDQSTQLISDIARSSEEQSEGIDQINRGIDQVSQVTQQNSATAEQSASASEEMSGQATMLEGLVSRFKLKNSESRILQPPAVQSLPMQPNIEDVDVLGKY